MTGLKEQLQGLKADPAAAAVDVQRIDAKGRAYATAAARTPSPACG